MPGRHKVVQITASILVAVRVLSGGYWKGAVFAGSAAEAWWTEASPVVGQVLTESTVLTVNVDTVIQVNFTQLAVET